VISSTSSSVTGASLARRRASCLVISFLVIIRIRLRE